MHQTNNRSPHFFFSIATGSLLLLSACGVNSPTSSVKGVGMNAANGTMISFGPRENKAAVSTVKVDTTGGEADVADTSVNPNATFKGCWYKSGKNRFQAVEIKVGNPGTYPFNALLHHGTTCSTYADQFGYGDPLGLGNGTYIFWFDAFKNDTNMSALWYLGDQTSKCMVYTATTPTC